MTLQAAHSPVHVQLQQNCQQSLKLRVPKCTLLSMSTSSIGFWNNKYSPEQDTRYCCKKFTDNQH